MDTNSVAVLLQLMEQSRAAAPAVGGITSQQVIYMLITAIVAGAPGIAAWLKSIANNLAIKEVHVAINSRLDEWIKVERRQGERDGRDEERRSNRSDDDARFEASEVRREAGDIRREAGVVRQEVREEGRRVRNETRRHTGDDDRVEPVKASVDENTAVIQKLLEELQQYRGMAKNTTEPKPALRTTD
jgi:hypothetical protein